MDRPTKLTRRTVLSGALGGGLVLAAGRSTQRAAADPSPTWESPRSANGWPVIAQPPSTRIEGTDLVVLLLPGPVTVVLSHCLRRYFYEIDSALTHGDVLGHHTDRRVAVPHQSNHLSGTAFTIRSGWYPLGVTGGIPSRDLVHLRDILADCEGVVRWGGDEKLPQESHFQIDVPPRDRRLTAVADKIAGWHRSPGLGAGAAIDPFGAGRRRTADALRDKQRRR